MDLSLDSVCNSRHLMRRGKAKARLWRGTAEPVKRGGLCPTHHTHVATQPRKHTATAKTSKT